MHRVKDEDKDKVLPCGTCGRKPQCTPTAPPFVPATIMTCNCGVTIMGFGVETSIAVERWNEEKRFGWSR